jgi:hypothetical protein
MSRGKARAICIQLWLLYADARGTEKAKLEGLDALLEPNSHDHVVYAQEHAQYRTQRHTVLSMCVHTREKR